MFIAAFNLFNVAFVNLIPTFINYGIQNYTTDKNATRSAISKIIFFGVAKYTNYSRKFKRLNFTNSSILKQIRITIEPFLIGLF
jgi:hypothetical protein